MQLTPHLLIPNAARNRGKIVLMSHSGEHRQGVVRVRTVRESPPGEGEVPILPAYQLRERGSYGGLLARMSVPACSLLCDCAYGG
jgi:hypothetical protein